ncbi:hypothetical protein BO94DRAFT_523714 [Aspergillus sclerotioniger CBS 115572]|uniref:Uncharacterized protein n=1 Tax=Aspergillus sclerotioniger CBS 115572 TaxID=1450535 RepID=A0A317VT24_9EURO|nr:hypothetical protein BO94DRAFT_523714 [Aspergillus sclerotioniger CBS 115572]PWY75988.1 hypothetical protein BO94DRAFT_523714 [Aspergillus sclerotioniger CBS 115572]
MGSAHTAPIQLPGFNLPLNHKPKGKHNWDMTLYPNALDYANIHDGYVGHINTQRELTMVQIMNAISEKPDWERKVLDDAITSKWEKEIMESGRNVSPRMMEWIIKEMHWKADTLKRQGLVTVFDIGVVRSDTAVSSEVQQALRHAVAPLEDIPNEQKDYHPGSDGKVLDLVHPSLFPLVYGRTRILPDRVITVDDCMGSIGEGVILAVPPEEEAGLGAGHSGRWMPWQMRGMHPYSQKFQWLPCNVQLPEEGGCRITSYINNLSPTKHQPLYQVVEKIIDASIPLWDTSLTEVRGFQNERIPYEKVVYLDHPEPEPEPKDEEERWSDEFCERHDEWRRSTPIQLPEPSTRFSPPRPNWRGQVNLRETFREQGLQVIVKLANIELTPKSPEYAGGSWHIEGQLNERICATAIYYYDSHNITDSQLCFRQRASTDMSDINYDQDQHEFLQAVYGFGPDVPGSGDTQITQDLGSVRCNEGRLLTFPNVVQHCVAPFGLADPSQPGHRKILALFLIDPNRRIISTANVPPQQEEWARERQEAVQEALSPRLPAELQNMVAQDIPEACMTLEDAKEYRLELMDERRSKQDAQNAAFETGDFGLCEH